MKSLIVITTDKVPALAKGEHSVQDFTQYIRERDETGSKANAEMRWAFFLAPDALKADLTAALKADEKDAKTGAVLRYGFTDSKVYQLKSDAALLGLIADGTFPATTSLDTLKNVRSALPLVKDDAGKLTLKEADANKAALALLPALKAGTLSQAEARKVRGEILIADGGTKKAPPTPAVAAKPLEPGDIALAAEKSIREHLAFVNEKLGTPLVRLEWEENTVNVLTNIARQMGFALVKQAAQPGKK